MPYRPLRVRQTLRTTSPRRQDGPVLFPDRRTDARSDDGAQHQVGVAIAGVMMFVVLVVVFVAWTLNFAR